MKWNGENWADCHSLKKVRIVNRMLILKRNREFKLDWNY